ncbi:MAG TPA: hypothetical protein VNT30_18305 [Stellaceae bacterium]|nr:hypothetical protein [Stellaceae bacterium]
MTAIDPIADAAEFIVRRLGRNALDFVDHNISLRRAKGDDEGCTRWRTLRLAVEHRLVRDETSEIPTVH